MNRIIRLFTIGILSVIIFGIATTQSVRACSGGSDTPLNTLIDNAEIIVHGQIIETDDANNNFILQVDTYLKGTGAEHLLVALYSPANTLQDIYRRDGDCSYPPSDLYKGMELLQFLNRRNDGAYVWSRHGLFDKDYYENQEITYLSDDGTYATVTYDEFLTTIQDYVGASPTPPDTNSPYPMLAPLLITTESGKHYLYPIDKQAPVQISDELLSLTRQFKSACWEWNCKAWSPNGVYSALLDEEGNVIINPNSGESEQVLGEKANAFLFSPSNDAIATVTQTDNNITVRIYVFYLQHRLYPSLFTIQWIDTQTVTPNMMLWSPDGRMLAYSDRRGVWVWDVFTQNARPELLAVTDLPINHFSPLGRYITIGTDKEGFSIDIVNHQILPAGVFSPDEQYVMEYGTHSRLYSVSPFRPDIGDVVENSLITSTDWLGGVSYGNYSITKIHWGTLHRYLALNCPFHHSLGCLMMTYQRNPYDGFSANRRDFFLAYDFAIHPQIGDIVIVIGKENLSFDMNQTEYDLSDVLDSPIASIEWLPSLFYHDD